jgi:uncharacterized membrane protein
MNQFWDKTFRFPLSPRVGAEMGRSFWIVASLLVGVIAHICYVLFAPGLLFARQLEQSTKGKPYNSFFISSLANQSALLPSATSKSVVGICKFDLGNGSVELNAKLPRSYWTLSVYSQSGRQVYALNDVQAGTSEFKVELAKTKTFFQQLMGNSRAEDATQIENLGWHAETSEPRGIAVIWIPIADELMRPQIESIMAGSTCKVQAP